MVNKMVVIKNSTGLHARPATMVVKKASSFKSAISIEFKGKTVNVKSLIGILSLGIVQGDSIKLIASGDDEVLALDEVAKLLETVED